MSRNIYVISDTHFLQESILSFKDIDGNFIRGSKFSSIDEMDEYIIEKWNSVIKDGDIVYHLGDVFVGDVHKFDILWKRLKGRKRLIIGNHDNIDFFINGKYFQKIMYWRKFPEFNLHLTHSPIHSYSLHNFESDKIMKNVHGHLHQNIIPDPNYINVSVDVTDYTPINIEELI
jgi:calcineurin-like phosphoesterase family protein